MPLRVVYDTSAVLAQMTPDPRSGSVLWLWMVKSSCRAVISGYAPSIGDTVLIGSDRKPHQIIDTPVLVLDENVHSAI